MRVSLRGFGDRIPVSFAAVEHTLAPLAVALPAARDRGRGVARDQPPGADRLRRQQGARGDAGRGVLALPQRGWQGAGDARHRRPRSPSGRTAPTGVRRRPGRHDRRATARLAPGEGEPAPLVPLLPGERRRGVRGLPRGSHRAPRPHHGSAGRPGPGAPQVRQRGRGVSLHGRHPARRQPAALVEGAGVAARGGRRRAARRRPPRCAGRRRGQASPRHQRARARGDRRARQRSRDRARAATRRGAPHARRSREHATAARGERRRRRARRLRLLQADARRRRQAGGSRGAPDPSRSLRGRRAVGRGGGVRQSLRGPRRSLLPSPRRGRPPSRRPRLPCALG